VSGVVTLSARALSLALAEALDTEILVPAEKNTYIGCVYPLSEDEVVFSQTGGETMYVARMNTETGAIRWKVTGLTLPHGIDYSYEDNMIAVAHSDGVALIDAGTGSIVKNITSVGGNVLGRVYSVTFNPSNKDEILFAVYSKHVVVKLNHVTGEYTVFGAWGTQKSDLTGLSYPLDVEIDPDNDDLLIADSGNSRVLRMNAAMTTVKDMMLLPRPGFVRKQRWSTVSQRSLMTVVSSEPGGAMPMYTFGFARARRLWFSLPMQLDNPRFTPDLKAMWGAEAVGLKIPLARLKELYISHPETAILLSGSTVGTSGYSSPPLTPAILGNNVLVQLVSSVSGTMKVQVPDRVAQSAALGMLPFSVPTNFEWVDADEVAFTSGATSYYMQSTPPPVFRLVVTPNTTATVTLTVTFYP